MQRRPVPCRAIIALPALALFAAAAACEPPDRPGATTAEGDSVLEALAPADFASVNRSDVTGTVRFEDEDDEVAVTIELVGLAPGAEYPTHLHTGRCAAGGPSAVPLGRVIAGEDGRGRLTTRVAVSELAPGEPVFIQAEGPDGNTVACADASGDADTEEPQTDRPDPDTAPPAGNGEAV